MVDSAQRIVCWNEGARNLLGYTEAEVLNRPCYKIISGTVCEKAWCRAGCEVQRYAKRGVPLQTFDLRVTRRDGQVASLAVSVFTFEKHGRQFTVHILRDRTREEHTKEALARVLDTLRAYGLEDGNPEGAGNVPVQFHAALPPPVPSVAQLTRREIEVLGSMASGLSTKEIAQRLGVSVFTVRSHIESILLKTGVHTQAQAVAYAYRAGLL